MNALLIAPLVLSACQAPVAATAPAPSRVTEQGAVETRVYDLRPLAPRRHLNEISDLVWPVLGPWSDEDGVDREVYVDDELPATLLRLLFEREFEYEDSVIEYLGDGRFAVVGPAAVHERITGALPQLEAMLTATVELELDVVRLQQAPAAGASVVADAQAAELVERAEHEGRLVRHRLSVSSTRAETLVQGRWMDLLADYNCEVAQGSYIFDPVVLRALLGTRLTVRAAPGEGGIFVALTMRRTAGVGSPAERHLARSARISNERDMRVEEVDLLHQRLPILDQALGLNTFLPEGQALVMAVSQGRVDVHELLVVRRVGGGLPRAVRLEPGPGGAGLLLLDSSGWSPPYAHTSWEELAGLRSPRDPHRDGYSLWVSLTGPRDSAFNVEDLLYNFRSVTGMEPGNVELLEQWVTVAPAEGAGLPDIERAVGRLAPDSRLVQLSLALRAPTIDAPVARLTLPLLVGLPSSVVLGVEDTYVADADVEIAEDAAIEDPILGSLFDGLMLELWPRWELDGGLVLGLQGQASAREGDPRKVDAGSGAVGEVEVAMQRFLVVSEELRFPAGAGPMRAEVGDLSGGLSLEVEVRL